MKTGSIVAIIMVVVVGITVTIAGVVFGIFNTNNTEAVRFESSIEAAHKDSENVLSQMALRVMETSGVARGHTKDVIAVTKAAIGSRYGEKGSGAAWQWIKEQNPTIDPSLRIKVQQIIDGGRTNFENSQRIKLDICKEYKNSLGMLVGGTVKKLMGFPKVDLAKMCEIVSSEYASEAFDTGIEKGIQGLDQ